MFDNIYKSAQKIKCPVCESEFIPQFFHIEKLNYQINNITSEDKFKFFKHSNSHLKPLHIISKSWVTSCPRCSYILRFAAELGDKQVVNRNNSLFNQKGFVELGSRYNYKFKTYDTPYKEVLYYDKLNIEEMKKSIIKSLESLDLYKWGKIYKTYNENNESDTFKFLIMFCAKFDEYCESMNDWTSIQNFSYKVDSLNISTNLKKMLLEVNKLQLKSINDSYILTIDDFIYIKKVYLKLMFEIILKELKLLNLDQIFQIEILEEFQRRLYFTEIKRTIHNLIEGNLNLGEESTKFVNNLLVSLKIPYIIENEDKPNKFVQKFLDFKNKIKSYKLPNFKNAVKSNKYKIINSIKALKASYRIEN